MNGRRRAMGQARFIGPDLLYNYDLSVDNGASIIESVSDTDTGIDWGTAYGSQKDTRHGIDGWRLNSGSDTPNALSLGSTTFYAIGIEILWCQDPISADNRSDCIVFPSSSHHGIDFGPATSSLTDEVITIMQSGSEYNSVRNGWVDATYSNDLSSQPLVVLIAWNGSSYDIYVDGEAKTKTGGGTESLYVESSVQIGRIFGSSTDVTYGAFAFWTDRQLTPTETLAIAQNYRAAIVK